MQYQAARAEAFGPLGLLPWDFSRLDFDELEGLRDGANWRWQRLLRTIAWAVYWLGCAWVGSDGMPKPDQIAKTAPGYAHHPEFDPPEEASVDV